MSKINIDCPWCRESLKVPDKYRDKSVNCPKCKQSFTAREQETPSPPKQDDPSYLSYDEWITRVISNVGSVGREGLALAATTAVVLGLTFLVFGSQVRRAIPAGRYPRIVLMLPFLAVTAVVFFVLSPLFYAAYKRRLSRDFD